MATAEEEFNQFLRELNAAPEPPRLSGSDAGPAARRAAAGMAPGPRNLSDEEAGVASGPQTTTLTRVGPGAVLPGQSYAAARPATGPSGDAL